MEPISIKYQITEAEFMTACSAHWAARRQSTASNLVTSAVAIVFGVGLLLCLFRLGLILVIVGSILLLATWLRLYFSRRAFREAKKYNNDILVVIKDDSLHVECAESKSDLSWAFFTWYLETSDHILLYMTKRTFSVIPKRAFPNEESVQAFMHLVESKLKKIR